MVDSDESKIRVVIADDEPLARQLLARLVACLHGLEVVGIAYDGDSAQRAIDENTPELVFLDVEMPGATGVELASAWRNNPARPFVIFVTAFDRYAIKAFDLDVIDYLVKPISRQRLGQAVNKAKRAIIARRVRKAEADAWQRHVVIKQGDELLQIRESDIFWLEAASQYVRIHTRAAEYIVAEPLNKYHAKLDPKKFIRVHRSAVVNAQKVQRVLKKMNGVHELQLQNGAGVPLSRSRKSLAHDLLSCSTQNRQHG